jgi:O-antigen ligase
MFFVALSIFPCVVMLFYQRPMLLLYLWPIMIVISLFFVDSTLGVEGLARSNIWLGPMDVVYFFTIVHLGLWASLHPKKVVPVLKENPFLSVFIAVVALYIIIDTPTWGKNAIGEARKLYFMFLIPWLAAVVIKNPADLRRFLVVIVWAAVGVAIIGVGTAVVTGNIFRPINAGAALYLVLAALLMLIHRIYRMVLIGPILDRVLIWLFFVAAITAGHRTAWLALGSGLLLALWLYGTKQAVIARVFLAIIIMIAGLGVGIALFPETGARLGVAFEGILDPQADANASWRIERWQEHLDRLRQDGNLLFGERFGSTYARYGLLSSHSAYVEMILKLGLFGLAIYSLLVFKFIRNALAVRKTLGTSPMKAWLETGILTFGAAHAYSTGYSFEPIMLVFLAVGNSACRLSQHRRSVEIRAARAQHTSEYRNFADVTPVQRPMRPRTNVLKPTSNFRI